MGQDTKIEWAHHTFNPWRGCVKVSDGCKNCYAEKQSHWNPKTLGIWGTEAGGATRVVAAEAMWKTPVKWNKRNEPGAVSRVFCASLADVFEDWHGPMRRSNGDQMFIHDNGNWAAFADANVDAPYHRELTMQDCRDRLFRLIDSTPHLDWLLVTKRPENIRKMWPYLPGERPSSPGGFNEKGEWEGNLVTRREHDYRRNVWIGTSVENQEQADKRIPELLKCSDLAPVLFLSCEPLIGPIDLTRWLWVDDAMGDLSEPHLTRHVVERAKDCNVPHPQWVIVGGESGPGARPCKDAWIRELKNQCEDAGAAFFCKQMGSNAEYEHGVHRKYDLAHAKGGDPAEWPEEIRVQEFPNVRP